MKSNLFLLTFFGILLFSSGLRAQYVEEDTSQAQLKTFAQVACNNGSLYKGLLILHTGTHIIIRDTNESADLRISLDSVREVKYKRIDASFDYHYNLQASRYFFGPNAFNIKRGEGYYQNNWVFLNQVSVGMSDNFTLGLATVPLFIFGLGAPTPVALSPKYSIPLKSEKIHLAVGGLYGTILGIDYNNTFGITYGSITLGNRDANINLSVGFGMVDIEWFNRPTISLSAMKRVNRKLYVISENYLISDLAIISFGGRSIWDEISLDYGLGFLIPEPGEYFGLPWLGITVPFKILAEKEPL